MASVSTNKFYLFTPAQGIKQFNVIKYFLQKSLMWVRYSTAETSRKTRTAKPLTDSSVTSIRNKASPFLRHQEGLLFGTTAVSEILSRIKIILFWESSFHHWASKQNSQRVLDIDLDNYEPNQSQMFLPWEEEDSEGKERSQEGHLHIQSEPAKMAATSCPPQRLCLQCTSAPVLQHRPGHKDLSCLLL